MTMKEKRRLEVFWETSEITRISFKGGIFDIVFLPIVQSRNTAFDEFPKPLRF